MDILKRIETLVPKAMGKDQYIIYRTLRSIKKQAKIPGNPPANNTKECRHLLKKVQNSVSLRESRQQCRPRSLNFDPDLPITGKKDEIIGAIKKNPVVIISGETGSGKTTQIPKFCLEAGFGIQGMIGCTQPRRIAAINVAKRIAFELDETLGQSVGYKIRFDDKTPANAYIKLMTDGILLAETQQDRFLSQYDVLIVDEAHERSLNIDFTLGLLRKLVHQRKDLKLIITSATIDTKKFSDAFDKAPIIEVSGRMYPVETIYMPVFSDDKENNSDSEDQGYVEAAAKAAELLLTRSRTGDILIFMPTEQDIGETLELIRGKNHPGVVILPLFARLSAREQSKIFSRGPGRKIIISTNVAETSLTIPGIKYVVDTGLARIPSYSPRTRTTALPVSPISQSSANQRQGRCGRIENGICIRLYDEDDFKGRPFFTSPEILRSNLAEVILRMIFLNLGDVAGFPFIDPPAPKSIKDGFDTLLELGAIRKKTKCPDKGAEKKQYSLTRTGRIMAKIPVDPKLSRILIEAQTKNCLKEATIIVTALTIADVRQRPADKIQAAAQKHALFKDPSSDFITLLNIWNAYKTAETSLKSRSKLRNWCVDHFLSFKRLHEWQDIHRQISRMLKEHDIKENNTPGGIPPGTTIGTYGLKSKEFDLGGPLYIALHKALLSGYLAGIAHKKEKNIFMATKGQQAVIFPGSGLFNKAGAWIVAAEFVKTSQLFARGVANIDPAWLEEIGKDLCTHTYSDPHWEKKRGEVVVSQQVSLFGLIIVNNRRVAYGRVNPEEATQIFIRHALVQGEIHQPLKFIDHNQQLIDGLEVLENKIRKKNILASEEDIYEFYHSRLPGPFFNIHTFNKFLKNQKDDNFLRMTLSDLQKVQVDDQELAQFPDTLTMEQGNFPLEYEFNPGAYSDGVTLKVPVDSAALVSKHSVDQLVPGLFEDKITALIKNLPKKYRICLVPVQDTAAIIARQMPKEDKPLFTLLSSFIQKKFHLNIPATLWSEEKLPAHLKMRISIRDKNNMEIKSMRDLSLLGQFASQRPTNKNTAFEKLCKAHEKNRIQDWSFPDLMPFICLTQPDGFIQKIYPGLEIKSCDQSLSLRLFKSRQIALTNHIKGIQKLFELTFPDNFKALKKDIKTATGLKQIAPYFNGSAQFTEQIFLAITKNLFGKDLRTKTDFNAHGAKIFPQLYTKTQKILKTILAVGREYEACFALIQKLSLQYKKKPVSFEMLTLLFKELKNLIPTNFIELYTLDRIEQLPRYLACIRIRAQRAVDSPVKETQKALLIEPFTNKLNTLLNCLSEKSSQEKAGAVESFYWLLEEYKISVFAQQLKTNVKISAKKLDKELINISTMV
ncbi:MAG: ATP-dependent RNA helicase HrpA [Desulfobacteraceae bacterium]|nr:ATP-dependent RNA helicase HrpA [Desulfobacteraceae bacterium]